MAGGMAGATKGTRAAGGELEASREGLGGLGRAELAGGLGGRARGVGECWQRRESVEAVGESRATSAMTEAKVEAGKAAEGRLAEDWAAWGEVRSGW